MAPRDFLSIASDILPASCVRIVQVSMSHRFIFMGSLLETKYIPMSFSGVSMPADMSLDDELFPTPGTSSNMQSCSGRERKVLNFLVVVVVIVGLWNMNIYV